MLAILALTAVFGVGLIADVLSGYELPEEDGDPEPETEEVEVDTSGFMPSQLQFESAEGGFALEEDGQSHVGTDGSDTVIGGSGDDNIRGGNGVDWLDGGAGDDEIYGGASGDAISGGEGADYILGGAGEDSVTGGAGDDVISLGASNDIYDSVGSNRLGFSEAGDDLVRGGDGNDMIRDHEGSDTLLGGLGNDTLIGTHPDNLDAEADLLDGGYGDDLLVGDNGDTLSGGGGADNFAAQFEFDEDREAIVISDFDASTETLTFSASDFGADAAMAWHADFDETTGTATIYLSGSHTVNGTLEVLDQEPAAILQNLTAAEVGMLNVTLDLNS